MTAQRSAGVKKKAPLAVGRLTFISLNIVTIGFSFTVCSRNPVISKHDISKSDAINILCY